MSASASTVAWPEDREPGEARHDDARDSRREVLRADPDRRSRAATPPVTSGDGSPQPVKRPSIMSQAAPNESARKKIQAKQTKWNVDDPCEPEAPRRPRRRRPARAARATSARRRGPARGDRPRRRTSTPRRARGRRAASSASGCGTCISRPPPVAAERDVEVVAQPARERHVPAPPEVLDRRRGVGRVEVLRERKPSRSAMPIAMSV